MIADLIIEDARIRTMDPERPEASRMAIWRGRILGFDEELDGLEARTTRSLGGRTVLPGFVDAHTHLGWTGMRSISLNVRDATTRDEVLRLIEEHVAEMAEDAWVEVQGYDQRAIGGEHVTAEELDRAGGGRPVWIQHMSGHVSVASTRALRDAADETLARDILGRGGLLLEDEQELVTDQVLPYPLATLERAIRIAGLQCLEDGVTSCVDAGVGAGLASLSGVEARAYQRLRDRGELPVRVRLMPFHGTLHPLAAHPGDELPVGHDLGLATGFGDERLSLGPVKFWFDGGMMARTAAFTEPYAGTAERGLLADDRAQRVRGVVEAHLAGWSVAIHAIGDEAIDEAILALRAAREAGERPAARHRIEHGAVIRDDQLDALRELGVWIVAQPCFLWTSGDDFAEIMGPERTRILYRGHSLKDAGVRLAASTDRPHAGTPLRAAQVLVERRSSSGRPLAPAEALTLEEALAAFTIDAARAAGLDGAVGSLEVGKLADFVVLERDPADVPVAEIGDLAIDLVALDGEIVAGRDAETGDAAPSR